MLRTPQQAARPRWRAVAGWSAAGAGVAALIAGAVLGVVAANRAAAYADANARQLPYEVSAPILVAHQRLRGAASVSLVAGGITAGAGLALLLWHYLARPNRRPAAPQVGVGRGGALAIAHF